MLFTKRLISNFFFVIAIPFLLQMTVSGQFGKLIKGKDAMPIANFDEKRFPPAISFQSLLTDLKLDPQTGILKIHSLQAYFLPSKDVQGAKLDYNPSTNNPDELLLRADLLQGGARLTSFYFEAFNILPVETQITISTKGPAEKGFVTDFQFSEAGTYELKFYLTGTHFYTFPFDVVESESDDPYSPVSKIYTLSGFFEDVGLLRTNYNSQGPNTRLIFQPVFAYRGIHLQAGNTAYLQTFGTGKIKCSLIYQGKVIGSRCIDESSSNDLFGDPHEPIFCQYDFNLGKLLPYNGSFSFLKLPVPSAGENFIQMKDLKDGAYIIEMEVTKLADRADFKKTFRFSVSNGNVVGDERGERTKSTDPLEFLEVGRDYKVVSSN